MKFICLGYADMSKFEDMPAVELERMMNDCLDYDEILRRAGHYVSGEALQEPKKAKMLRFAEGKVQVTDGPFSETKEQLGGIMVLEADSLEQAVELMSKHPGVRVGPFEIRPADEVVNEMIAKRLSAMKP